MKKAKGQNNNLKLFLFVLMILGALLLHIAMRTKVITQGYEIGKIRSDIQKLEGQIKESKVMKAKLMSSRNLEEQVKRFQNKNIILKEPEEEQIIFLTRPLSSKAR